MPNILALDIEAIVDTSVWTPPKDDPEAFAPPNAWRPIVSGCALLGSYESQWVVRKIGTIDGFDRETGEATLLKTFADMMNKPDAPTVVTWNGRAYDIPVLMLRSMRYGISHRWYYQSRDTRYRFTETGTCDLADAMGDFGAARHMGLDGMAKLIGLPGKFGDIDGAGVAAAHAAGRDKDIAAYCLADAVQTAFVWLRWQLLKSELSVADYRSSAGNLLKACEAEGRLAQLCERVDRRVLLLADV